jgi:hypothetical protein
MGTIAEIANQLAHNSGADHKELVKQLKKLGTEPITIILNTEKTHTENNAQIEQGKEYSVYVRQYMTKYEKTFFLADKNEEPMPYRFMYGKVLEETNGLIKMELYADIKEKVPSVCMKCGRELTNNVSKYFGVGPECGGHDYNNPFETEEELREAIQAMRVKLNKIKWVGWIIKSAILEMNEI